MKQTSGRQKAKVKKPEKVSVADFIATPGPSISGVWNGRIARLRVYVSTRRVFAYLAPGNNDNYVGSTDDPNTIHALFLARDNGRVVWGYTDDNWNIGVLDY